VINATSAQSELSATALSLNDGRFTFRIMGTAIAKAKIQIFDLNGQTIYESGFVATNALRWDGLSQGGARVANGVYLYVVTIKGYNEEIQIVHGKLVVMH